MSIFRVSQSNKNIGMVNNETIQKEEGSCQPNDLIPSNVVFRLSRIGISTFSFQSRLLRHMSDIHGIIKAFLNLVTCNVLIYLFYI